MAVKCKTTSKEITKRKRRPKKTITEKIEQEHIRTGAERLAEKKKRISQKNRKNDRMTKQNVFIAGPEEIHAVGRDAFGRKIFEAIHAKNTILFKAKCPICGDSASICQTRVMKHHELYVICPYCETQAFIHNKVLVPYLRKHYLTIVPHFWNMVQVDKLVFFYELSFDKGVEQ